MQSFHLGFLRILAENATEEQQEKLFILNAQCPKYSILNTIQSHYSV